MKKYRYYSSSLSRHVMPAVERHLPKIGTPTKVEGLYHGKNPWFEVIITGTTGKLVLRGCSWGYHGEGSRATEAVLKHLGVHPYDVQTACFDRRLAMPDEVKASNRPVWRIHLPACGEQLREANFVGHLFTHATGQDRRWQPCKCSRCGKVNLCTPCHDFYGEDGEPLVCESCFMTEHFGTPAPKVVFDVSNLGNG